MSIPFTKNDEMASRRADPVLGMGRRRVTEPPPTGRVTISAMLVESVPNYSEGRRLDVVDRLARRRRGDAGRVPPRSDERRVPQPLRPDPRRRGGRGRAGARGDDRGRRSSHRHGGAHAASTRGSGRSTSSRSCRSGSTTIDDCVALARSFGARIAERFGLPVYLYARAATRPDRVRLADVRRGGYEAVRDEIAAGGGRPRARTSGRSRPTRAPAPWRSARGRS